MGNAWNDCYVEMKRSTTTNSTAICTFDKKLKFFEKTVLEKCRDYCPLECESKTYSVSYNFARREPYTTIVVYYRTLKYTLVSQEPKMRQFDLVSNVGGIFGLFIGISFVTLFEIFEILFEILCITFKKNRSI